MSTSSTVLAVGAHIGDMDLTAGPALARWVLEGRRVIMLACTYGERGHPGMAPEDYLQQKVAEGKAFAAAIGAEFETLGVSDGFLPDSDPVAERIAELIRAERPDRVVTHWRQSVHSDHRNTHSLVRRACFLAALPTDSDLPPHRVPEILCADNWEDAEGYEPDAFVEIPDEAHERWLEAIRGEAFARGETTGFRFIDYYEALMNLRGCLVGRRRACGFRRMARAPLELD